MSHVKCFEISQPMGTYYFSKLSIGQIEKLFTIHRRDGNKGIQRKLDEERRKGITKYCQDSDAIFPTPIIFSISSNQVEDYQCCDGVCSFVIRDGEKASVVDGQHRIYGILASDLDKSYEMPVVFMFDITEEEEAYIFSTINFNQKKVDKSLIYDLFGVYTTRSPKKTCHEIAKALNDNENSPFYRKLKILGKKERVTETLSQGTFVHHLLPLICPIQEADDIARKIKDHKKIDYYPKCIFNKYFMNDEDTTIYTILFNYFGAVEKVFKEEWGSTKYILSKTTGYGGLMMALKEIFPLCEEVRNASLEFFVEVFTKVKENMDQEGVNFTSVHFGSGEREQKALAQYVVLGAKIVVNNLKE